MKGVARKGVIDRRKLRNGPLGLNSPCMGLRLEKDRFERLQAKAEELGGISRAEVIRRALERFGV